MKDLDDDIKKLLVMEFLGNYGPAMLSEATKSRNHCVLSTRCAIEVLRQFGFHSTAVPVSVVAGNEPWVVWVKDGAEGQMPEGAWSAGVTGNGMALGPEGEWDGHLVTALDDQILDLSISTFSRPDKGLQLPEAGLFKVPEAFWTGEPLSWAQKFEGAPSAVTIIYRHTPDNQHFKQSTDWRKNYKRVAEPMIRSCQFFLEKKAEELEKLSDKS